MDVENGESQVQIRLKTKQEPYAVPDNPYYIESNVTTIELNNLLNTLLGPACNVEFEFLVSDEYLRGRLCDHLHQKCISFEEVVEIEYIERFPAPEPQDCLLHDDWVSAVKTEDKWILTGSYDNSANIWTTQGKHILTLPGHTQPVKAVTWVSLNDFEGVFVTCSQDQTCLIWKWNIAQNTVECSFVCKGHERGIECVDTSPDAVHFATGSWDTMLKIWSTDLKDTDAGPSKRLRPDIGASKTPKITLQGHRECISAVQWLDNSIVMSASWDHTMKIWDLQLEGIASEISTNKSIFDASYSKINRLIITASADKNVRLYDSRTKLGSIVQNTYFGHSQWVQSVMWSSTEEHLFVSGAHDNQNKLWDCRSPKAPLYDLIGHSDKVLAMDWSNPKYIVSGGADNTVRIFKSHKAFVK